MIHICAMQAIIPAARLIAMILVTGHPDALQLREAGHHYHVPAKIMWSVAYEETRHSRGDGVISSAGAYGRMQVMPSIWGKDSHCTRWWLYHRNINCGAYILSVLYKTCGDWTCARYRYVGGDSTYVRHTDTLLLYYELALKSDAY